MKLVSIKKTFVAYKINELSGSALATAVKAVTEKGSCLLNSMIDAELYGQYEQAFSQNVQDIDIPKCVGVRVDADTDNLSIDYDYYVGSDGTIYLTADSSRRGVSASIVHSIYIDRDFIRDCLEQMKHFICERIYDAGYSDKMHNSYRDADAMLDSLADAIELESPERFAYRYGQSLLASYYVRCPDDMPSALFDDVFDNVKFDEEFERIAESRVEQYIHDADCYVNSHLDVSKCIYECIVDYCNDIDMWFYEDGTPVYLENDGMYYKHGTQIEYETISDVSK